MSTQTHSQSTLTPRERRLDRRMAARGEEGFVEILQQLRGCVLSGRYQLERPYAIGGQGMLLNITDLHDRSRQLVGKMALLPLHRAFDLTPDDVRRARYALRVEGQYLQSTDSPFMPEPHGIHEFQNPLLDPVRGDAFAELEPVLVMEKVRGHDLSRWLTRVHARSVTERVVRTTNDRIAVGLCQALTDLRRRGMLFADLCPGNMRVLGRPRRRLRLLDAGSLVSAHDQSGRFPHVPAYLPPAVFAAREAGARIVPSDRIQAVMAGRVLFEVVTGSTPVPGEDCDLDRVWEGAVSPPVAEAIAMMCRGNFSDMSSALRFLQRNATRRVTRRGAGRKAEKSGGGRR